MVVLRMLKLLITNLNQKVAFLYQNKKQAKSKKTKQNNKKTHKNF